MGYRSDIRIRLKTEDYENLVEEYKKKFPEDTEMFGKYLDVHIEQKNVACYELNNNDIIDDTKESCVFFGWNDLKWYNEYTEVQFIMNFIQNCTHYAFCRIGESCEGDIEQDAKAFGLINC